MKSYVYFVPLRLFMILMLLATQIAAAAPVQHTVSQVVQQRIAFASNRDHPGTYDTDIYTMNVDGSDVQRLTTQGGISPDWSPDGTQIVFESSLSDTDPCHSDIYTINTDRTGFQQLALNASEPDWSPDGKTIAFTRSLKPCEGSDIYIINADKTGLQRLTPQGGFAPDWSPDGRKIAFTSIRDCDPGFPFCVPSIYVINADGSSERKLYEGGARPKWSPDGTQMLLHFTGDSIGSSSIRVIQSDGSNPRTIIECEYQNCPLLDVGEPGWSGDGSKIVFAGKTGEELDNDIYTIKPDKTNLTRLTTSTAEDIAPAWSTVLPPLTIALFTGDAFTTQKQCYELVVVLRNTTSSTITKEISIQESAAYQRVNATFGGLPQGRADVLRDCDTNAVLTTGGSISKTVTIPANSSAEYRFRLSHNWDWIERPVLREYILQLLQDKVLEYIGGEQKLLIEILKLPSSIDQLISEVSQAVYALPRARYTYTLTVPDISTGKTTVVEAAINPWQGGYLRGSITATAVSQILCPLSTFFSPAAPGCAAATGTSISLYFAAYGEIPTISTLQVTNLAAYTTLIEPPSIPVTLINTITDPAQRQFAQSYVTALSLQRAALASHANALDAAAAHDLQWDATQRHRAGLFLEQESRMLDQATRSGQTFLPTTAMPDATALQAIKDQLNSTGFSQSFITTSHEMGLSDAEIAVLRSTLIRIPVDEWPQPADMLVANVAYRQSQQNLANLIDPMVLLPLVQR